MQDEGQLVSFLIMVAIMFLVTAMDAVARRRRRQEEMQAMAEAELLEEAGEASSPLETMELDAVAEDLREESRRELRETEEPAVAVEEVAPSASSPSTGSPRLPVPPDARRRARQRSASSLLASLRKDPAALRRAVLYREILGPPLGARENGGGWQPPSG